MNSATFAGRVGNVRPLSSTSSGKAVLNFSLAVDRFVKKGEESAPLWVGITLWEKQAEALAPYITKGSVIAVTGEVDLRSYETNGENRTELVVKFPRVKLLGGGQKTEAVAPVEMSDEDIPF